ncbi:hypothetical protein PBY51_021301 [Eleginops maclovinus]|uniref:Uncharacterized protein n=1 Tax=Eleginops maclovinus TaxID=56733 RepID=A0AAN7XAS0_ELEMC|nr:hypothetical protein PBY51_021301 [Eleginops maclovinus]
MRQSATLTPLLVQREAGQAQADSRSNILRAEKREVPGETRGTGIPNHSPQSSHHHTPPNPKLPLLPLSTCSPAPPQTHTGSCLQLAAPPILSQRKSPVVFPVAMFYLFTRALLQKERGKKMKTK